ncbi:MAG: type II toxin-antitoxin system HicB family antitoxin [Patescibacteria group bacterium]|nr:type II toxin-antitoxin system HicB family antitoxin [Patescibacteria group bacterium]
MSIKKKVQLQFSLPVSFLKEGKYFIAHTPSLDLSTSGKTFEEAKKRFEEIVQIFFEELVEKGTLEEVLTESGWQKVRKEWFPPSVVAQESESFELSAVL